MPRHSRLLALGAFILTSATIGWHVAFACRSLVAATEWQRISESTDVGATLRRVGGSYAEHLPSAPPIARLVADVQRSAAAQNVSFGGVSIGEQPATDKSLGHATISITLRGPYPRIKDTLADVAERFPAMAVKQVSLRRAGAPLEVDARVDLLLATRPLAASAPSGS